jgi:DNA-binding CsgD family transcriptional regulator
MMANTRPSRVFGGNNLPARVVVLVEGFLSMTDLTTRELETAKLVSAGYTNREIGVAMGISAHTVKYHVLNVGRKLGVSKRVEIAAVMIRAGMA